MLFLEPFRKGFRPISAATCAQIGAIVELQSDLCRFLLMLDLGEAMVFTEASCH